MNKIILIIATVMLSLIFASCEKDNGEKVYNPDTSGKSGSMARITIAGDYLYLIDNRKLCVFDISSSENPVNVGAFEVNFGIETIFYHKGYLFIGSSTGMYIYDISSPDNPVYVADFAHVMSCDPVVVNDTLAFVTLRSSGDCRVGFTSDQLDIIDISDITAPELIVSHNMSEPYGLGLDGEVLFICQGSYGLGVYSFNEELELDSIARFPDINGYDVIPDNNKLLVVGETGFYQYDYSNIDSIFMLSQILIGE